METLEPTHDHEEGRTHKSKAPSINALEPCIVVLETLMTAVQHTLESLEEKINGLKCGYAKFTVATKALIQDQANILRGEFRAFHDELLKLRNFMQDELWETHAEVEEVRSD